MLIRRECHREDTYSYDVVGLGFQSHSFLLLDFLVSELYLAVVPHLVHAPLLVLFLTGKRSLLYPGRPPWCRDCPSVSFLVLSLLPVISCWLLVRFISSAAHLPGNVFEEASSSAFLLLSLCSFDFSLLFLSLFYLIDLIEHRRIGVLFHRFRLVRKSHLTEVIALLVNELLFDAALCVWSNRAYIRTMLALCWEDKHRVIDFIAV